MKENNEKQEYKTTSPLSKLSIISRMSRKKVFIDYNHNQNIDKTWNENLLHSYCSRWAQKLEIYSLTIASNSLEEMKYCHFYLSSTAVTWAPEVIK